MRLIDADKLENILSGWEEEYKAGISQDGRTKDLFSDGILSAMFTVFWEIKKAPAVDAVPVMHAHYIQKNFYDYECSNCHVHCHVESVCTIYDNYCPNCGAKTDEEVEEKK